MKIIAATAAILLTSASAYAADAIVYKETASAVADTFSWTGGYIGVNAGYAGGKFKHLVDAGDDQEVDPEEPGGGIDYPGDQFVLPRPGYSNAKSSGFIGGVQAGYNWQIDRVVLGIETDIQASGIKADNSNGESVKVSWFGTTRARLGYTPVDRFMVYATGGVAYGKIKATWADQSQSDTKVGYTVGAGAEYAVTNNWTLKSEYLYTDLGKMKYSFGGELQGIDFKTKTAFHTVRVGLNYKF